MCQRIGLDTGQILQFKSALANLLILKLDRSGQPVEDHPEAIVVGDRPGRIVIGDRVPLRHEFIGKRCAAVTDVAEC